MEAKTIGAVNRGNWVSFNDIPHIVTATDAEGVYIASNGTEVSRAYEDIAGIEITPDILEKAGFVKEYENPAHISYGADNPKIGVYYFKDGSTPTLRYISEKNIPCRYLHQLQNLILCLTGQPLEIKL